MIEQALKLAGEPFIVDSLGWVEYRLGNLTEAARLLSQAHAARPDAEIAAHLGEVLWVSGKAGRCRRVWREALPRRAQRGPARDPGSLEGWALTRCWTSLLPLTLALLTGCGPGAGGAA